MLSLLPCTQKDTDSNLAAKLFGTKYLLIICYSFCDCITILFWGSRWHSRRRRHRRSNEVIPSMDRREGALSKLFTQTRSKRFIRKFNNLEFATAGAALLPVPGMLIGLSLGLSIKIALFFCSIAGGFGWLHFLKIWHLPTHSFDCFYSSGIDGRQILLPLYKC